MSYTPPPRPPHHEYSVTLCHTTGTYTYLKRATSAASAIVKARTDLGSALNIDPHSDAIRVCAAVLTGVH